MRACGYPEHVGFTTRQSNSEERFGAFKGRAGAKQAPALGDAVYPPDGAEDQYITMLGKKLVKIGAKVVSHGRYVTFQLAEVAVPRNVCREIPPLIDGLRRTTPAAVRMTRRQPGCRKGRCV